MKCWSFLSAGPSTLDGQRVASDGQVSFECTDKELVKSGICSSDRLIAALYNAQGPVLCRGKSGGRIVKVREHFYASEHQFDWTFDCTDLLNEFSLRLLKRLCNFVEIKEDFVWKAIEVKEQQLAGDLSIGQMIKRRDELFNESESMPKKPRDYEWACVRAIWLIGEDPIWQQASDLIEVLSWVETKKKKAQEALIDQFEVELLKLIKDAEWE